MKIYHFEQGSEEWYEIRRGVLSASNFDRVVTPKTGKLSASAVPLMHELALQRLPQWPDPHEQRNQELMDKNFAVKWGNDYETEAREWFSENKFPVQQVGFVKGDVDELGCSPDGLVADPDNLGEPFAGLEIKCPALKTHTNYSMENVLPDEYKLQVHGSMAVTGLNAWFFMSYYPKFKPFIKFVVRDSFTELVGKRLSEFVEKYREEREAVYDAILWNESEVQND